MTAGKSAGGYEEKVTVRKTVTKTTGGDVKSDRPTGPASQGPGEDVQPGTAKEGKSWQSRRPDPDDPDDKLNQALKDSFPASDPPQAAQPGVTGWDVGEDAKKAGGKT